MSLIGRCAVLVIWGSFAVTALLSAQVNVVTARNDVSRDGLNSSERVLNQRNVNSATFGKICSAVVDGQLYAQPLVISILGKNIVFLGTMNGSVYAIDGNTCRQLGHVSLIPANEEPVQCVDLNSGHCSIINPIIGILSTPVIDLGSKTIYVEVETESTSSSCQNRHEESCFMHRLHALDLTTLAEKFNGPVVISGVHGNATFTAREHIQRPGLLELPNVMPNGNSAIYLGFSAIAGYGKPGKSIPQGWVFGYDAQNLAATPVVWSSTSNGEGGGVWQSGGGLAAGLDAPQGNTYLYVATGDGTFDVNNGGVDYGDSFIKLTPQLTTLANGFFTPFNQACLDPADEDFGSGGILLTPDITSKYYAITGSKTGEVFVMDRANPGGYTPPTNHTCPATGTNGNQEYFQGARRQYFTTPAYWNLHLYYVANQSPLIRYKLGPSCNPGPVCTTGAKTKFNFGVGTLPAISSSGDAPGTAIVWGASGNGWPGASGPAPAVLYALDAEHENPAGTVPELWDSTQCRRRDGAGNAIKFVTPTVANGMVYLGTMDPADPTNTRGELDVYGLTKAACN